MNEQSLMNAKNKHECQEQTLVNAKINYYSMNAKNNY